MKKYNIEDVRKYVNNNNTECELVSEEYINVTSKLKFICKCGRRFEKSFHHLMNDTVNGCKYCAKEYAASKVRLSIDDVQGILSTHGCEYVSGEYKNRKSKFVIKCKCGHTKTTRINTVTHDGFTGLCDDCLYDSVHGSNRLSVDTVRDRCESLGVELVSDTYSTAKGKILVRCNCGKEFTTSWNVIKSFGKVQCGSCTRHDSKNVKAIDEWLTSNGFNFEKEKSFKDLVGPHGKPYRFDFYIPGLNMCIEYDGEQHFRPAQFSSSITKEDAQKRLIETQERDSIKDSYCESNGITLIRIPYKSSKHIDSILNEMLIPR